ncbi:MAG: Nif3-like dinuclear metal center hexameric protein [Flavobacteriales bacterium]|jgi:dinuclear metal center YbgI/SA1388 family protein|nr:Nif3-like dinuclear metal center hexameric protein [Flavobacteriales bacterium]MBT6014068.1 Nif3-like dinuclear metal center hexameric protein [Flavobacteriales bacterium]MBT7481065.1 Nif3-like dinuclear metal center hexameric protein [Flavobacteriales bacterium]
MKIKEITQFLEGVAPLNYQESYDNSGLIVGDENKEVTSVLICLDSVEQVIDEAIENRCNLVIAHHPIVFSGLKKLNGKNHIERTIIKSIKNDIAIYAIHTNLDNVKGGVSSKIADKLGLKNQKILTPKRDLLRKLEVYVPKENAEEVQNALFSAGAGSVGDYKNCSFQSEGVGTFLPSEDANPAVGEIGYQQRVEEVKIEVIFPKNIEKRLISEMKKAHPYEEVAHQIYILEHVFQEVGSGIVGELETEIDAKVFLETLKKTMKTDCIRHTKMIKNTIKKVAVCGGSGSFLLNNAKGVGSDIFITADFKYHEFFNAENDIIIADIGHYESEQFTKELIYDLLINNFSKFAVRLSKVNTNPINYL